MNFINVGAERFGCMDVLLLPNFLGTIASGSMTLLSSVMKCDVDIRKELYANVVLPCDTTRFFFKRFVSDEFQGSCAPERKYSVLLLEQTFPCPRVLKCPSGADF